jgi:hypothetical protein
MIYSMLLIGTERSALGVTIIYPRAKRLYLDDEWDMKNLLATSRAIRQETLSFYYGHNTLFLPERLETAFNYLNLIIFGFKQMNITHLLSHFSAIQNPRGDCSIIEFLAAARITKLCCQYGFKIRSLDHSTFLFLTSTALPARMLGYQAHLEDWTDNDLFEQVQQFFSDPTCGVWSSTTLVFSGELVTTVRIRTPSRSGPALSIDLISVFAREFDLDFTSDLKSASDQKSNLEDDDDMVLHIDGRLIRFRTEEKFGSLEYSGARQCEPSLCTNPHCWHHFYREYIGHHTEEWTPVHCPWAT